MDAVRCPHAPDWMPDATEYLAVCQTCGEVLGSSPFTRPTLAHRVKHYAGSAGTRAAGAALCRLRQLKWDLLYLCVPELWHSKIGAVQRREQEAPNIPKLPIRFAILTSLQERYPQASEEVSRRILLVDKALDLRLSRGSCR